MRVSSHAASHARPGQPHKPTPARLGARPHMISAQSAPRRPPAWWLGSGQRCGCPSARLHARPGKHAPVSWKRPCLPGVLAWVQGQEFRGRVVARAARARPVPVPDSRQFQSTGRRMPIQGHAHNSLDPTIHPDPSLQRLRPVRDRSIFKRSRSGTAGAQSSTRDPGQRRVAARAGAAGRESVPGRQGACPQQIATPPRSAGAGAPSTCNPSTASPSSST
jgi:hypothetical protein